MFRYNTTATPSDALEYYDAETAAWVQIGSSIDGLTDGISNTCPTLTTGDSSLFKRCKVSSSTAYLRAIAYKVSPAAT